MRPAITYDSLPSSVKQTNYLNREYFLKIHSSLISYSAFRIKKTSIIQYHGEAAVVTTKVTLLAVPPPQRFFCLFLE